MERSIIHFSFHWLGLGSTDLGNIFGMFDTAKYVQRFQVTGRGTDQVLGGDGLSPAAGGYHHPGQAAPHVLQAAGESQHCHDLTGHRDVKLGLGTSGGSTNRRHRSLVC